MTGNTIFDELEKSNNILLSAISHLEIAKDLINSGVSRIDSKLADGLPIDEINCLSKEYIEKVRYIKNRIESIVNANTMAVYAPPDILFEVDNTELFK